MAEKVSLTKGINHLRKALNAPEDYFGVGTSIRLVYPYDEEPLVQVEVFYVKLKEDEWIEIDGSNGHADAVGFREVVKAIQDVPNNGSVVEIAHTWKPLKV